jgi:hypothetical protein
MFTLVGISLRRRFASEQSAGPIAEISIESVLQPRIAGAKIRRNFAHRPCSLVPREDDRSRHKTVKVQTPIDATSLVLYGAPASPTRATTRK